jgi:hypothetical protein
MPFGVQIDKAMIDRRLAAAGRAVGHKMSMLQDFERHRTVEIGALVGCPGTCEIERRRHADNRCFAGSSGRESNEARSI